MAKALNQVFLTGRLTSDIEVRQTPGGKAVGTFSLAVDNQGQDAGASFFEITAWEKTAELMQQYTRKGSKVLVQGRLAQQTWEDKDTQKKRSKVTITATDIQFLDSKQDSGNASAPAQNQSNNDTGEQPINLDDIPF